MKILIALCLFVSGQALACSCTYDYEGNDERFFVRAARIIGIEEKNIQVNNYDLKYTAAAMVDPAYYSECGCTSFVKRIWDISYDKNNKSCEARIVAPVYNDSLKVKDIVCK